MKNKAQPMGAKRKATLLELDIQTIPKQSPNKRACKQKEAPKKATAEIKCNRLTFYGYIVAAICANTTCLICTFPIVMTIFWPCMPLRGQAKVGRNR